MIKLLSQLTFIFLLFVFSPFSYALTVGDKQLNSMLNQKLDARVALMNVRRDEAATMTIKLAPNSVYDRMGLVRSPIVEKLTFSLEQSRSGQYYIQISSDFIVSKPFITFLVELSWNNGRLLREFTLFMDPPMFLDENLDATDMFASPQNTELLAKFGSVAGEEADDLGLNEALLEVESFEADLLETGLKEKLLTPVPVVALALNNDEGTLEAAKKPEKQKLALAEANDAPTVVPAAEKPKPNPVSLLYNAVKKGENLRRIAENMRPANVTVEQMMLALQKENPGAFADDNLASLKEGAELRINDVATITAISPERAAQLVLRQREAWLASKKAENPVVVAVAEPPKTAPKPVISQEQTPQITPEEAKPEVAPAKTNAVNPVKSVGTDNNAETVAENPVKIQANDVQESALEPLPVSPVDVAEVKSPRQNEDELRRQLEPKFEAVSMVKLEPALEGLVDTPDTPAGVEEETEPAAVRSIALVTPSSAVKPALGTTQVDKHETVGLIEMLNPVEPVNSVSLLDMLLADKKMLGIALASLLLLIILVGWMMNRLFYRRYVLNNQSEDPLNQQVPQLTDVAAAAQTTVVQFDDIVRKNAETDRVNENKQPATVNSK